MMLDTTVSVRLGVKAKAALSELATELDRKTADLARIAILKYLRETGAEV